MVILEILDLLHLAVCLFVAVFVAAKVEQGRMDVPRWSHAMYAVQSVPNWKIFVFGGIGGEITDTNRQGTFMNDVSIFDTGTERWIFPDVQGDPPLPRGDMQLEYYQQVKEDYHEARATTRLVSSSKCTGTCFLC